MKSASGIDVLIYPGMRRYISIIFGILKAPMDCNQLRNHLTFNYAPVTINCATPRQFNHEILIG
jgi:hypothetical protein